MSGFHNLFPNETFSPDGSGANGKVVWDDDVPKKTKVLLSDYIGKKTRDKSLGNVYPVRSDLEEVTLSTPDGVPQHPGASRGGAERVHASSNAASDQRALGPNEPGSTHHGEFNKFSDSGIVSEPSLSAVVIKGQTSKNVDRPAKVGSGPRDGHELLIGVDRAAKGFDKSGRIGEQTEERLTVLKRTSAILALNRFSPGTAFSLRAETRPAGDGGPFAGPPVEEGRVISSMQTKFGEYDRDSPAFTSDRLARVGKLLSLRSSGEFAARQEGADPNSAGVVGGALIPGEAQLAVTRIDTSELSARAALRDAFLDVIGGGDVKGKLESDVDVSRKSYGNLTNCVEHFDSIAPAGMIALAFALILAAQVSIRALLAALTMLTSVGKTSRGNLSNADPIGRPYLGEHRRDPETSSGFLFIKGSIGGTISSMLGLQEANFDYTRAVIAGMDAVFGSSGGGVLGKLLSTVTGGFKKAAESPGYYAVFVRNIARSLNTIGNAIESVSFSGNVFNTANSVLNVISVIKRSKLIAALNIFAQIGDRVLSAKQQGFDLDAVKDGIMRLSRIDLLPDNAPSHVMKSRRSDSLKLAWRTSSSTSKMLLPTAPIVAGLALSQNSDESNPLVAAALLKSDDDEDKFLIGDVSRINADTLKRVEDSLDAEYVPFYFHDLRTNEIVSFHAFLESITDSFSPAYEEMSAYGRVDPVMIYSNTKRNLSVTFYVVSTNNDDFDEMYAKVNKLVTLVYPQFSLGSRLDDGEGTTFIQPFSQIVSGSPLIRIRIGDLVRSNYSKFALARLFGLGTDAFSIDKNNFAKSDVKATVNAIRKIINRLVSGKLEIGDVVKVRPKGGIGTVMPDDGYRIAKDQNNLGAALGAIIGLPSSDPIPPLIVAKPTFVEITAVKDAPGDFPAANRYMFKLAGDDKKEMDDLTKVMYVMAGSDVVIDNDVVKKTITRFVSGGSLAEKLSDKSLVTKIHDFFDAKKNAVIRSFESSGGRGLAGVITSMQFDWGTGTWETERRGSRAPKVGKIMLEFTPIHDIAPGIDVTGFNRAPVYNVGRAMNAIGGDGPYSGNSGASKFDVEWRRVNRHVNSTVST